MDMLDKKRFVVLLMLMFVVGVHKVAKLSNVFYKHQEICLLS